MGEGTLTHVGYWTTPNGIVFPVYSFSLATTYQELLNLHNSKTQITIGNAPVGLGSVKGTIIGESAAIALEYSKNESEVVDSEIISIGGLNYTRRYIGGDKSTSTLTVLSGTVDYIPQDSTNNPCIFANYLFRQRKNNLTVLNDTLTYGSGGNTCSVIIVVDRDGEPFFYMPWGDVLLDGTIENSNPAIRSGTFQFGVNVSHDMDEYFGIVACSVNYVPNGDYTPGTNPPSENPYPGIDPSVPSGGGGSFDDTSDPIPDSSTPTLSSANTGFTRIYNPSLAQVQALANYLWTDESVITTIWNHIKQYFEDPMQAIIGFNLVPVPVPNGGTEEFKLMYIGTGVQMTVAANQFVDVDCGTLIVEKYYGSALDYSPYTKISCFLPFIGNVDLNPDEVMDATLQIKYRVDICSGSCVAKILVNGTVLYQYSGHCAIPIPLASSDFASYVSAAVSVAKLAIGAAVAGGAGAAAAASTEAGQATGNTVTTTIQTTARNPETGRQITTGTQTITQTKQSQDTTKASFEGLSPKNISNTVGEIMTSKPTFQHSGSFSGNTGYLGIRRPYLIITRPNLCMPASYQSMNGFPCMVTLKLGDCSGFTQVQQCILSGFTATNPEQSEILQLLKSGVIL